ncbi:MAG: Protein transport protein S9 plasma membrane t-SNARE [Chaenotheca gracillima]|nr:MAG: Protein transport protein S9 plasma membrane t-SNARE [Chaenotheca gracillima]
MVKSYLKYELSNTFGLINSATANVIWTPEENAQSGSKRATGAGRVVVPANEEVLCWDVKKGELLSRWRDPACRYSVTAIAQSKADKDVFALGYDDGSIRLWDAKIPAVIVSFNGHRSAITTLEFDRSGTRLASGAKDTDIIVWDLVAEVGLFKLRGHKDQITGIHFVQTPNVQEEEADGLPNGQANGIADSEEGRESFLMSTGKDSLIKLWDINSRNCIETHVAQSNGECWALGVSPDDSGCITAGNDGELKVWSIDLIGLSNLSHQVKGPSNQKFLNDRGVLYRQGKDRALGLSFHPKAAFIAVHGSEKAVEIWRIRSEGEVKKSLSRKRKRRREKEKGKHASEPQVQETEQTGDVAEEEEDIASAEVNEIFVPYVILRTGGKVRGFDWAGGRVSKALQVIIATTNNQLELYNFEAKEKAKKPKRDEPPDYSRTFAVEMPGHRTDIRSLSLSSDDRMLASASNGSDKIVVVGTKTGDLELFDVASSTMIDSVRAHEGSVWTLQVHPDGKSVATGGADKSAKFWNFEIVQEEVPGTKRTTPRLHLAHTRTLKVSDDILSLRFSPDARLLAISLLDNTVKVFFVDTLKLFLNLYGHKLPVLNMDISHDSKLIVTCSADKNIRLWGLDFGDCHKAFFAHQDSIMAVSFVPQNAQSHHYTGTGHYFFSASKDHTIKYWDGDKFEQIQKLDGHHGEIWALAVGHSGDFLVSASHDKSIRVWSQTDEPIFLEEERERELEELYESTLTTSLDQQPENEDEAGDGDGTATAATKQTVETLKAGERIAEALEVGLADLQTVRAHAATQRRNPSQRLAPPQRNPIFLALGPNTTAESYVLSTLEKISAAALQDALLVLPFSILPTLFTFLDIFATNRMNVPLTCRILFFMLRTHHAQIVASKTMRPLLESVRAGLRTSLVKQKDTCGFNLAALRILGQRVGESGVVGMVGDELDDEEEDGANALGPMAKGRKKRNFVDVA